LLFGNIPNYLTDIFRYAAVPWRTPCKDPVSSGGIYKSNMARSQHILDRIGSSDWPRFRAAHHAAVLEVVTSKAVHHHTAVTADAPSYAFDIEASRVRSRVAISHDSLNDVWIPIALLLVYCARSTTERQARKLIVGVFGGAATGKTTACMLLELICDVAWDIVSGGVRSGVAVATISMDAYHLPNATLVASGLKHVKGRVDTIDAVSLSSDLRRVASLRMSSNDVVALPEYDRAVSHDPVANAKQVSGKGQHIILVEGLYLCSGDRIATNNPAAHLSPADVEAWRSITATFDIVIGLAAPVDTLRQRTIRRKMASSSAPHSQPDAEQYFDTVDLPVITGIQVDLLAPSPSNNLFAQFDAPSIRQEYGSLRGPDLVLHSFGLDSETLRIEIRGMVPKKLPLHSAPSTGALHRSSVHVLGLNPCIQRTLDFHASDWQRDTVNRADAAVVTTGGKGQHCFKALVCECQRSSETSVRLYQFRFGRHGAEIDRYLTDLVRQLPCTSSADNYTVKSFPMPPLLQADTRESRNCVTLLGRDYKDMTELIEPSAPVTSSECSELVNSALTAIQSDAQPADTFRCACTLMIMGTAPPGGHDVYSTLLAGIAPGFKHDRAGRKPLVVLDTSKNVGPLLDSGLVEILKVNEVELNAIAAECIPTHAAVLVADTATNAAVQLFKCYAQLDHIAMTMGSKGAMLFSRTGMTECVACKFHVPSLSHIVNPIGAGDTVAAVWVAAMHSAAHHVDKVETFGTTATCGAQSWISQLTHDDVVSCLARGLAAGSASCLQIKGAEWSPSDAESIFDQIRLSYTTHSFG
jgi:pantothenate kinase/fructose-1-phosphate kinase PfkB-like protein